MRTLGLACLLLLVLLVSSCGNVFVRGFWGGGNQTVSGTVSIVQFTIIFDNNVSTQVTIVTLLDGFGTSNFTFCGDQRSRFPADRFAEATFSPGQPCATLLRVVINS